MANSKQGGMIITNLPNSETYNVVEETTQEQKSALAEQGNIENNFITQPVAPIFQKTLGNTLYTVSVHFSNTSRESFEDKILRMLESAVV